MLTLKGLDKIPITKTRISNKRISQRVAQTREIFCHEAIDCPPPCNLSTDKQMALPNHRTAYLYYCEPKDGLDVASLRAMVLKPSFSLLTLMIL